MLPDFVSYKQSLLLRSWVKVALWSAEVVLRSSSSWTLDLRQSFCLVFPKSSKPWKWVKRANEYNRMTSLYLMTSKTLIVYIVSSDSTKIYYTKKVLGAAALSCRCSCKNLKKKIPCLVHEMMIIIFQTPIGVYEIPLKNNWSHRRFKQIVVWNLEKFVNFENFVNHGQGSFLSIWGKSLGQKLLAGIHPFFFY